MQPAFVFRIILLWTLKSPAVNTKTPTLPLERLHKHTVQEYTINSKVIFAITIEK